MKITNTQILRSKWVDFFKDIYHLQGQTSKKVSTERYCRCDHMNVKLILKLTTNFDFREEPKDCLISTVISLSTDCISLRKSNYFWSDKESFTINYIVYPEESLDGQFEKMVDDLLLKIDQFKICCYCRILYQEDREEELTQSTCINCRFDSIFFVKDTQCVICHDDLKPFEQSFTLTCGHTFHSPCILQSFIKSAKRECPLCRESDVHQM